VRLFFYLNRKIVFFGICFVVFTYIALWQLNCVQRKFTKKSININLTEWGIKANREVKEGDDLDESIQELVHDLALKLFKVVIQSIEDRIVSTLCQELE
jgi:hypothetical protein